MARVFTERRQKQLRHVYLNLKCNMGAHPLSSSSRFISNSSLSRLSPLCDLRFIPAPTRNRRYANFVLEPVLREPGSISFQWMEIQRTRASLLQQQRDPMSGGAGSGSGDASTPANNETDMFGYELRAEPECEYKCPELNACIDRELWCDGE